MKIKFLFILSIFLLNTACTHAGPFVTNISFGKNEVIIEKCQVQYNAFFMSISTENCTNQTLTLW